MKQKRRHGHGRRLLEIGKDILIVFLVLVNVTLAIMCLPTKTLTQTKWLASALRPFAGLFGLTAGALLLLIHLAGLSSLGVAYLAPFSDARAWRAILRPRLARQKNRDPDLHPQDSKNQR